MTSDSIASEIERIMQSIRKTTTTLRTEYRAKRLAQQKKKHQNEKTRLQYKKKKQATPSTPKKTTQPATQQKQKSEKSAKKDTANNNNIRFISYGCNFFRLPFLTTKHYHKTLLAFRPDYIKYAKNIETTGEG